jgi:hypothetical protein
MADNAPVSINRSDTGWTWRFAPGDEIGEPVPIALDHCCVQVAGEFDGTIVFEGSNDGESYVTLRDGPGAMGRSLTFASPDLRNIYERPAFMRPRATGDVKNVTIILSGRSR